MLFHVTERRISALWFGTTALAMVFVSLKLQDSQLRLFSPDILTAVPIIVPIVAVLSGSLFGYWWGYKILVLKKNRKNLTETLKMCAMHSALAYVLYVFALYLLAFVVRDYGAFQNEVQMCASQYNKLMAPYGICAIAKFIKYFFLYFYDCIEFIVMNIVPIAWKTLYGALYVVPCSIASGLFLYLFVNVHTFRKKGVFG